MVKIQYNEFMQSGSLNIPYAGATGTYVSFYAPFQTTPRLTLVDNAELFDEGADKPYICGGNNINCAAQSSTVVLFSVYDKNLNEIITTFNNIPSVMPCYQNGESGTLSVTNASTASFTLNSSVAGTVGYIALGYKDIPNRFFVSPINLTESEFRVSSLKSGTITYYGFGIESH